MAKTILFGLVFFLTISAIYGAQSLTPTSIVYVDGSISSSCQINDCGSQPFKTISEAIQYIRLKSIESPLLLVKSGTYSGSQNIDIFINFSIEIRALNGSSNTSIDCQDLSSWITIEGDGKQQVSVEGFTIRRCSNSLGGAIQAKDTTLLIKDSVFNNNHAFIGGAIQGYQVFLNIYESTFKGNDALKKGGAVSVSKSIVNIQTSTLHCNSIGESSLMIRNDIECDSSKITFDKSSSYHGSGFLCSKSCKVVSKDNNNNNNNNNNICTQKPIVCDLNNNNNNNNNQNNNNIVMPTTMSNVEVLGENLCPIILSSTNFTTGDGICNPIYENCLNSNDCKSCYFSGIVLESYKGNNVDTLEKVSAYNTHFSIKDFMSDVDDSLVFGNIKGFLKVPKDGNYRFETYGTNLGAEISIDSIFVVNAMFQQNSISTTNTIYLESSKVHSIKGSFFSLPSSSPKSISLKVFEQETNNEINSIFYSKNNCGDGVYDDDEICSVDLNANPLKVEPYCGDGICNEIDINSCFIDCYKKITPICPARKVVPGHLSPGFKLEYDTLGWLISNQFLWHMPGSEHMAFGVDIVSGKESKSPVFYFGYCDSTSSNIVEDLYRQYVYDLPKEIYGKMLPQCVFSTSSKMYQTTQEISTEMYKSTTKENSLEGSGGNSLINLEAKVAFTEEKSVKKSESKSSLDKQSIFMTDIVCSSSVMELSDHYTFHPVFLDRLSKVENIEQMYQVVADFGTHIYKKAVFGGKLRQFTTTSRIERGSTQEGEWKNAASRSFSGSINTPVFKARAYYEDTIDSSVSSSMQRQMEKESTRTTIITYGGPLGSYGPSNSNKNQFDKWADGVDTLPVPIDYSLKAIRYILNPKWFLPLANISVVDMWRKGEELYYYRKTKEESFHGGDNKFLMIINFDESTKLETLPIVKVNWAFANPIDDTLPPIEVETVIKIYFQTKIAGQPPSSPTQMYVRKGTDNEFDLKSYDCSTKYSGYLYLLSGFYNVGGIESPYSFRFDAPDFISKSIVEPKFTIENGNGFFTQPIVIISFNSNTSTVIDQTTGQILYNDKTYMHTQLEKQYGAGCPTFVAPYQIQTSSICSSQLIDGTRYCVRTPKNDKTTVTFQSPVFIGSKTIDISRTFSGSMIYPFYYWNSHVAQLATNDTQTPITLNYTSYNEDMHRAVRVNWFLMTCGTNSVPNKPWIRGVFAGHSSYGGQASFSSVYSNGVPGSIHGGPLSTQNIPIEAFDFHNYNAKYNSPPVGILG